MIDLNARLNLLLIIAEPNQVKKTGHSGSKQGSKAKKVFKGVHKVKAGPGTDIFKKKVHLPFTSEKFPDDLF